MNFCFGIGNALAASALLRGLALDCFIFLVLYSWFYILGFIFLALYSWLSDFTFQISDFRFQISGFRFQISNFRFRSSDAKYCCFCMRVAENLVNTVIFNDSEAGGPLGAAGRWGNPAGRGAVTAL